MTRKKKNVFPPDNYVFTRTLMARELSGKLTKWLPVLSRHKIIRKYLPA
jgi:hypothetical protein